MVELGCSQRRLYTLFLACLGMMWVETPAYPRHCLIFLQLSKTSCTSTPPELFQELLLNAVALR